MCDKEGEKQEGNGEKAPLDEGWWERSLMAVLTAPENRGLIYAFSERVREALLDDSTTASDAVGRALLDLDEVCPDLARAVGHVLWTGASRIVFKPSPFILELEAEIKGSSASQESGGNPGGAVTDGHQHCVVFPESPTALMKQTVGPWGPDKPGS